MRGPRYWARRAWLSTLHGYDFPCTLPECPESMVGYSHWCREHTDQIMEGRLSPRMVEELRERGHDMGRVDLLIGAPK